MFQGYEWFRIRRVCACGILSDQPLPIHARALAVRFLRDVFQRGKHLDALSREPVFLKLDERDRRLVTELVYGVLRNRGLLDFYIAQLSRRPLRRLDQVILWILRVGLYQTEFLRVPDRAAVHEAVSLCRWFRKSSAAGFVNAVLRHFLRKKPVLPAGSSPHALAIGYSHPEWLVQRYLTRYGLSQTEALLKRNNQPPLPSLWVNVFKTDLESFCERLNQEAIDFQTYPNLPNCLLIHSPTFSQHDLYRANYGFFMDVASQEIAYLAKVQEHRLLGDFCAAPGGKSFLLASQKSGNAKICCCDSNLQRLREMEARSFTYQVPDLYFVNADLSLLAPWRNVFDFVLLDVPCSGLGTLRSNPDLRWKIEESNFQSLHDKQVAILRSGFAALRRGGELVYATCSTEPEENEQVVEEFLSCEGEATLLGDFHRTFPGPHPGECFFAARIRHG